MLLAFVGIFIFRAIGWEEIVPYIDPVVVLCVVAISIGVPVRMAWNALMALLNRAPSRDVVKQVSEIVDASLSDLPVQERYVRVIQPGRQRLVLVHVVLPADYQPNGLAQLDELRSRTHEALAQAHMATIVDILFTTEHQWGAPLSEGGAGGV